jgi:uncharacterized protein YndB with AHSA1/START domain
VIDVINEVEAIRREVGSGRLGAGEGRQVRLRRTYTAQIDDVWDALTNPERIGRWFLPVSGDYRLGGNFQFEGNAGGKILECERPNRLLVTWGMGDAGDPATASEVELRLTAAGSDTTDFELVHTAIVPDEMWSEYGPGAVGVGWDGGLLGLALHLATGKTVENPEAWPLTEEGRSFYTRSSAAWGEASRVAGVDAETVTRNVANTTSFYTGLPAG